MDLLGLAVLIIVYLEIAGLIIWKISESSENLGGGSVQIGRCV